MAQSGRVGKWRHYSAREPSCHDYQDEHNNDDSFADQPFAPHCSLSRMLLHPCLETSASEQDNGSGRFFDHQGDRT